MLVNQIIKLILLLISEPGPTIRRIYLIIERKYLKNAKVICEPVIVKINTGYKCNLHCPLCPTGRNEKKKIGDLKLDEAEFIVNRIGKAYRIQLFGWGEPYLNNEIFQIISFLKRSNKYIRIDSNLNINNDKILDSIAKSNIDELSVSLDGIDQKSYSEYRYGGSFDIVFRNLLKLIKSPCKPKIIIWQYLVSKKNIEYVERAKIIAQKNNICIRFSDIGMYQDMFYYNSKRLEHEWRTEEQIGRMKNFCKIGEVCKYMYNDPFIDPDGKVYPCCNAARVPVFLLEKGYENVFGNLHKNTLFEIWNNEYYQCIRKLFAGRKYSNAKIKPICLACKVYLDSRGLNSNEMPLFDG